MKKKYMFFDIDGTLTDPNSRKLVPSAVETLQKLQENGHFVGIATGRPHAFAKEFARMVNVDNYVCSGGNALVLSGKIIENRPLPRDEALRIIRFCKQEHLSFAITTESDTQMYSEFPEFKAITQQTKTLHTVHIVPAMDYENVEAFRRIFIEWKDGMNLDLPIETLAVSNYHRLFLTIEPDDKFLGIERMMQYLDAPVEDVVVFGDGINDIQMFKKAPLSIAMGNAIEEIKSLADYITNDSVDDGILNACKHFNWI